MYKHKCLKPYGNLKIDVGYSFNSSGLIRDALPNTIERTGKPTIRILKYPHGTTCIYEESRALICRLWSGKRAVYDESCPPEEPVSVDLMLHMGMRSLNAGPVFRLERFARRDAYNLADEVGKHLPSGEGEKGGYWEGLPETLSPGFDVDSVANMVALAVPVSCTVLFFMTCLKSDKRKTRIYRLKSRQMQVDTSASLNSIRH